MTRIGWRVLLAAALLLPLSAALAGGPKYQPRIAGPWQPLFRPEKAGNYLNDHCLYQDPKGDWHLVGITALHSPRFGTGEYWFAHGVTSSLTTPMRELDPLFKGWPDNHQKWAPHALWAGDTLHLFAGPGAIRHFSSRDGYQFEYVGIAMQNDYRFLRDTMVLKLDGGGFVLYATDLVDGKDSISAWRSKDLDSWTYYGVVFTAVKPASVWAPLPSSACESPFVVKRDDGYYLSMTLTNQVRSTYIKSPVFFSEDPLNFGVYAAGGKGETARYVTTYAAHAPEIVKDGDKWWITTAGWPGFPRPEGCPDHLACIAPLEWKTAGGQ